MPHEQNAAREKLLRTLRRMKIFEPDGDYYALSLGANRRERVCWSAQTHWVGMSERNPRWEVRAANLVRPEAIAELWSSIGQGWVSVHDDAALAVYLRLGGNALVAKQLAEDRLSDVIAPSECVHDGSVEVGGFGFLNTEHLRDDAVERRAPTRKLRMQVLKRDGYRCVICGRKATDHTDIELHVHHLIPWRMAGPTAEENLVTLCGTCHKGLEPDFEPTLRKLAGLPGPATGLDVDNSEFNEEVTRYRQLAKDLIARLRQPTDDPQQRKAAPAAPPDSDQ
ncbi:HNH endonuclease [Streptomyces chumphonensis]|uniref:HNH endonuclease n=1 Tax=Streptomyces chumphonensis TaxID=1214925 RepID=UPI003D738A9D